MIRLLANIVNHLIFIKRLGGVVDVDVNVIEKIFAFRDMASTAATIQKQHYRSDKQYVKNTFFHVQVTKLIIYLLILHPLWRKNIRKHIS